MQKVGGLVHTRASMIVLWQRITSLVSPTGSESFSFFWPLRVSFYSGLRDRDPGS